jgi:membrane associated rhomboid family serine protease
VIPIKDDNPTRHFPWMTVLIIAANAAVFAYMLTLSQQQLQQFIDTYAFVPGRFLADPTSPQQWFTGLAATFMHGGWLHIGFNMLYLWIFGNNVEDRLGPLAYLAFYLVAGTVAFGLQTVIDPTSTVPLLGASGAIAGVLGGYLVLYPRVKVLTVIPIFIIIEIARIPAAFVIGFWFVLQLFSGIGSLGASHATGGVAYFAHVGGFVAGLAMALPLALNDRRKRSRVSATWR